MIGASIARLSVLSKGIGEESVWSKKGQQLPRTREWNSDNVTVYGINYYVSLAGPNVLVRSVVVVAVIVSVVAIAAAVAVVVVVPAAVVVW